MEAAGRVMRDIRFIAAIVLGAVLAGCSAASKDPDFSNANQTGQHIPLDGQPNFRDLGGYPTKDGRRVKSGMIYRSGELNRLSEDDVARLEQLGIATVVDFRSSGEVEARGADRIPDDVAYLPLRIGSGDLGPVFIRALRTGDFSQMPDNVLADTNRSIVRDATDQYSALLEALSKDENLPLVFHCTHGKDRAGLAAAVVLMALGVSEDIAREDYLLSNVYRKEENESGLERMRQRVAAKQGIDAADVDMSRINDVFVLQSPYFDAMLDEIEVQHGSFENYLKDGLSVSDSQLDRLRDNLIE